MASVAIIVGAAIINAVAFTTGNALYDKFWRTDGSQERGRHDKAIEYLQKATTELNQKRLETLQFINDTVKQKDDAQNTFNNVDYALEFHNKTHPDGKIVLPYRPVLEDFYKPNLEHTYYEIVAATVIGGLTGYLPYNIW